MAARTEFLEAGTARDYDAEKDEGDGEDSDGGVEGATVQLYVSGRVPH